MKKHIPNLLTLGNMLCGMMAILLFISSPTEFELAVILIGIAAVLDFFDGFVARWLGVSGEMGKQLDSLADVVSFGVAPAFGLAMNMNVVIDGAWSDTFYLLLTLAPLSIALFSALRLAKFNIDTRQTDQFIGLPTPANTIMVLSITWAIREGDISLDALGDYSFVPVVLFIAFSSLMLIAELPLIALKFKSFNWRGNEARYATILLGITIFAITGISGLSLVVLLYLLISFIDYRIHRHEVSR